MCLAGKVCFIPKINKSLKKYSYVPKKGFSFTLKNQKDTYHFNENMCNTTHLVFISESITAGFHCLSKDSKLRKLYVVRDENCNRRLVDRSHDFILHCLDSRKRTQTI